MSSIDERVVQMRFENSQFEKSVKETIKSLSALKTNLSMDEEVESIQDLQNVSNGLTLKNISNQLQTLANRTGWVGRTIRKEIDATTEKVKNLGKTLTVGQISSGWSKYEQKTASVQTIMNATGKTIDEVNGYLDKLMWFSDETSYNFTEMTSALGTLTSSGGDIEKMIPMIEGMATATAFAGKTASEFSRVIYNLNQSYGQGYLSYMDWRSVELAGVGSEQLKNTLLEAGVAAGTLKKLSDGTYKTTKGTKVTAANMASTLSEKWATTEVMEKGFSKFAEVMEEAYKLVQEGKYDTASEAIEALAGSYEDTYYKAAKAAQEAKSFKEAIEATTDAVSSGWMKSFEIIFGNYEEAKEIWTDLANGLWEVFASGSEYRNEVLEEWKKLGGRADLIQGVTDALSALWAIISAVKDAFYDIFPRVTSEKLLKVSTTIKNLGASLKELARTWTETKKTFGLEPIDELVGDFEVKRGDKTDNVKELQQKLSDLGYGDLLGKAGVDGIFGKNTEKALKKWQEDMGLIVDGVYDSVDDDKLKLFSKVNLPTPILETIEHATPFLEKIKIVGKGVFSIVRLIGTVLVKIGKIALGVLKMLSPVFNAVLNVLAIAGNGITSFVNALLGTDELEGFVDKIKKIFTPVEEWLQNAGKNISAWFGLDEKGDKIEGITSKFSETWKKFKEKIKPIFDWFSSTWTKIKRFFFGISEKEKPNKNVSEAMSQWEKLGEKTSEFKKKWESFKGSLNPIFDWFSTTWIKIKNFFTVADEEDEAGNNITSFQKKWIDFKIAVKPVFDWIETAWNSVVAFFTDASIDDGEGNKITRFAETWKKVKEYLSPVVPWFKNAFYSVKAFFTEADEIDANGKPITSFVALWEKAKKVLVPVIEWFKGAWTWLKEAFSGKTISESFTNFWNKLSESLSNLWKSITGIFSHSASAETLTETISDNGAKKKETPIALQRIGAVLSWLSDFASRYGWIILGAGAIIGVIVSVIKVLNTVKSLLTEPLQLLNNITSQVNGIVSMVTRVKSEENNLNNQLQQKQMRLDFIKSFGFTLVLMAAAFYAIATLPEDGIKRAGIVMGAMIGVLILVLALSKVFVKNEADIQKLNSVGALFKSVGVSLLLIAGAIFLLGIIPPKVLIRGGIAVAAILAVILVIAGFANKKAGSLNMSFNMKIAGFIGVALTLIALAAAVKILGEMDYRKMWQGIAGVAAVVAMLIALIALTNLTSKGNSGESKVILKFTSIALLLAVMCGAVWVLGTMDQKAMEQGMKAVGVLMIEIMIVLGIASKIGSDGSAKVIVKIAGIAVLLLAMVFVVKRLSEMDYKKMWQGIGGLGVMMLGIIGILWAAGKATSASMVGILTSLMGLIWLLAAMVAALKMLDGLDPDMITGFIGGIGKMLIGLSVMLAVASKVSPASMAKAALGLSVAMGVIVLALIALMGALALLNTGGFAESIIKSAGRVIRAIGNALGQFAAGYMEALADGIYSMREGVEGLSENKNLDKDLTSAFNMIKSVVEFFNEFSQLGTVKSWNNRTKTNVSMILENIKEFGEAIGAVATGIKGLSKTKYKKDTSAAIEVANMVSEALVSLNEFGSANFWDEENDKLNISWNLTQSRLSSLLSLIGQFGSVVGEVRAGVEKVSKGCEYDEETGEWSEGIVSDTSVSKEIIQLVATSLNGLAELSRSETWQGVEGSTRVYFLNTKENVNTILDLIGQFGTAVGLIKDGVSGLGEGGTYDSDTHEWTKTPTAIKETDVATEVIDQVVACLNTIRDLSTSSAWTKPIALVNRIFGGGTTQIEEITSRLKEFGEAVGSIKEGVEGLGDGVKTNKDGEHTGGAVFDTEVGITIIDKVVEYLNNLLLKYGVDPTSGNYNICDPLDTYETAFGKWSEHTTAVLDEIMTDVALFTTPASNLFQAMKDLGTEDDNKHVESNYDMVEKIFKKILEFWDEENELSYLGSDHIDKLTKVVDDTAASISTFHSALSELSSDNNVDDFESDYDMLEGIFKKLLEFWHGKSDLAYLGKKPKFGSAPIDQLTKVIKVTATTMSDLKSKLKGLANTSLEDDVETITNAFSSFYSLLDKITEDGFDTELNYSEQFIGYINDGVDKMMSGIKTFIEKTSNKDGIGHISKNKNLSKDLQTAIDIYYDVFNLLRTVQALSEGKQTDKFVWDEVSEEVFSSLTGMAESISTFTDYMSDVDDEDLNKLVSFMDSLAKVMGGVQDVSKVSDLLTDIKNLFTGDSTESGTPQWIKDLNSEETIDEMSNFITNFTSAITPGVDEINTLFEPLGRNMAMGVGKGMLEAAPDVDTTYISPFVQKVIDYIKAHSEISSPSRVTAVLGSYMAMGLGKGMADNSKYATDGAGKMCDSVFATLSSALAEDVNMDPIIRPIVDMSDVESSSRRLNGLLSADRSIDLASGAVSSFSRMKAAQKAEAAAASATSGDGSQNSSYNDSVSLTGNNFYIRSEQDIHTLANEIASLTRQQQRSLGARY